MRRPFFFAALGALLAAPCAGQTRVGAAASESGGGARAVPAFVGAPALTGGLGAASFSTSLVAPAGLSAPSFAAPDAPRLGAAPGLAPAFALVASPAASLPESPAPSAAAPESGAVAAPAAAAASMPEHPRDWDFGRWRESFPTEDASSWKFGGGWFAAAKLWDGWRRAAPVGEGAMGSVFVHPWDSEKVVKVARPGYADSAGQFMSDDETVLSYEDYDLARLAAVGAAPKPLARLTVSGRPASARERVRGFTVAELKRDGRFGERERALVHDLLERIADGGFVARDLNLGNIVIGRVDGSRERAWLVDALGVAVRDDLDAAGRKAEMLAEPVPWIAVRGFGLGRPLSKALDSAVRPRFGADREAIAWPRWRRWTTLAGLLGALAFLPALAHATMSSPLTLGILPSWPAFALVAVVLGVAGIPLRLFAHRLAPWTMTRRRDAGEDLMRRSPWGAVPELAIGAAIEEAVFRGFVFVALAAFLHAWLPLVGALAAASFASSLAFALVHGYGSVWTRVVGGMLYAGAFAVSGSLLLPAAAHFAFNLSLYLHGRYLR